MKRTTQFISEEKTCYGAEHEGAGWEAYLDAHKRKLECERMREWAICTDCLTVEDELARAEIITALGEAVDVCKRAMHSALIMGYARELFPVEVL